MKEVLIISYYFPPLGMGGVQRPAKWAKYLPEFGWKPVVITVKDIVYYAYDYSILREIEEVPVFRTESLDPLRVSKWFRVDKNNENSGSRSKKFGVLFRKFFNYWFIPDIRILWVPFVIAAAVRIISGNREIKAVITSSPPNSTHIAGYWIKKIFGIKWIADLRDDWAFEIETRSPTIVHRRINRFVYKKVLQNTDKIITVSGRIAVNHSKIAGCDNKNVSVVRNGYDPDDFKDVKPVVEDKFTVVYTGSVTKYTNPYVFLSGLYIACKENPVFKNDLLVKFAGTVTDIDLNSMVKKFGLEDNVKIHGYLNHSEVINILSGSDVALLLISESLGEGMVTGKIYEYIGAGKHIFALIPDCDASDILATYGNATIGEYNKSEDIAEKILRIYEDWRKNKSLNSEDVKIKEGFGRVHQVGKLSGILNDLL